MAEYPTPADYAEPALDALAHGDWERVRVNLSLMPSGYPGEVRARDVAWMAWHERNIDLAREALTMLAGFNASHLTWEAYGKGGYDEATFDRAYTVNAHGDQS